MPVTALAVVGDSTVQQTGPVGSACTIAQGGRGGCWELAAEMLGNLAGVGPLLTSGIRGTWLADSAGDAEWSFTSGGNAWTEVATTDAWDKCLSRGKFGNGINKIATYTHSSRFRSAVGFDFEYCDYTNGGNWQYRVNGGTWTNMGQTLAQDNQPAKFYVNTALTPGSTVEVRCYNGSSDCGCCLDGIRPWYASPSSTQGLVVDLWGANGTALHAFLTSTAGDRLDIIDSGKLGTGSPRANTPGATVLQDLNDAARANTTEWATDLTSFNTRFSSLGLVGVVSTWEVDSGFISTTNQANYRAQTKTTGASLSMKLADLYDQWAAMGLTGFAPVAAAGFLNADVVHLSQNGHLDAATRLYWFIRNQILGIGNVPSSYPVSGKQPAVAYAGKQAAVAYGAGTPVSVG